jgi:hypothetical protein
MDEVNKFLEGFKVLTTNYDKVDTSIVNKKNIMTALNQIGGTTPGGNDGPPAGPAANAGPPAGPAANAGPPAGPPAGPAANAGPPAGPGGNESNNDGNNNDNGEGAKGDGKMSFFEKAKLSAARNAEESKGTDLPDGKEVMKKVIKIGSIIIYIMLLPLMPWYYIMKNSYAKVNQLFKGVIKPL